MNDEKIYENTSLCKRNKEPIQEFGGEENREFYSPASSSPAS
jgi:hypothetical protein